MSKKVLFTLALIALLVSCTKSTTLYFKTNDAKGLELGDYVMIDEQQIGTVTGFGLTDKGDVIISSDLNSEFQIPSNSKFKNSTYSKEGQRCIKVTLGDSETSVSANDTIQLRNSFDKIINKGKEKLLDQIKDKFGKKDK